MNRNLQEVREHTGIRWLNMRQLFYRIGETKDNEQLAPMSMALQVEHCQQAINYSGHYCIHR